MSLWDVSMLLISSLQQSRYSSFYLDFSLQHLTSGTGKLSSKPNNTLHRHWLLLCFSPKLDDPKLFSCYRALQRFPSLVVRTARWPNQSSDLQLKARPNFSASGYLPILLRNYVKINSEHSPKWLQVAFFPPLVFSVSRIISYRTAAAIEMVSGLVERTRVRTPVVGLVLVHGMAGLRL